MSLNSATYSGPQMSQLQPPPMTPKVPVIVQPPAMSPAMGMGMRPFDPMGRCAQGIHSPETKYGPCGIITAIVMFPIGLICLFADTHQRCAVCKVPIPKN